MPGFQSFFSCFASFCICQISHQQHIVSKLVFNSWTRNHVLDSSQSGIIFNTHKKHTSNMSEISKFSKEPLKCNFSVLLTVLLLFIT